jgi:hypothetical protein
MLEKMTATLTGVAPMIHHNGQLADPLNKYTRALKEITSKRKKTDEDYEEMQRVEWYGSLYIDDKGEPCITGDMIEAWAIEGAKKSKLGKQARAAMFCEVDSFPLQYEGTRDPHEMWASRKFRDYRGVKVQQSRVMRCRPIFRNWTTRIELTYNLSLLKTSELKKALEDAGQWGLGDYRPRFGRCLVEIH